MILYLMLYSILDLIIRQSLTIYFHSLKLRFLDIQDIQEGLNIL